MKKILSIVLIMIMALPVIGSASARSTIHKMLPMEAQKAAATPITEDICLGSDYHEIAYGDSKVDYNGKEYKFLNNELVCGSGDKTECLSAVDGDNLNISNNKLYYSVYEAGIASVVVYDLTANTENMLFHVGTDRIVNMYVINNSRIELLAGGMVYCYDFNTKSLETVEAPDDAFNFIPTAYGNIYGTGSSVDAAIVFMDKVLVRHATYYSVEDGAFIATINGITYQMPLSSIFERCNAVDNRNSSDDICSLQDMDIYDFYGTKSIDELFSLDDDDCEACDNNENTIIELPTVERGTNMVYQIIPNTRQQTIIDRASDVVNLTWEPLVSFCRWRKTLATTNQTPDYVVGNTYTGLPYSRTKHFNNNNHGYKQVYIGYDSFVSPTELSSLAGFSSRVTDSNDQFNLFAATNYAQRGYGPLYGMDCSRFVSYAWGYSIANSTLDYIDDDKCCQLTSVANNGYLSLNDLALLLPGDALVSYDNHAILVTAVYKNNAGNVVRIDIMEEIPPLAKSKVYNGSTAIETLRTTKLKPSSAGYPYQIYRLKESLHLYAVSGSVTPNSIPIITNRTYGAFNNNSLPTPVRTNYIFLGWYTQITGGNQITASTMVENDGPRKLYAHWMLMGNPLGHTLESETNKTGILYIPIKN